jgi:uncharacterized delta-60 repeat protein
MKKLYQLLLYFFSTSLIYAQAGSLDPNFSGNGKVRTLVGNSLVDGLGVTIQPDQKIVVVGDYLQDAQFGGGYSFAAVRYLPDGTLDNSFGYGGKVAIILSGSNSGASSVAIQSDGKIVMAGYSTIGGINHLCVMRLTTDGILDNSFNGGGISFVSNGGSGYVTIQSDGKILIGCTYVDPVTYKYNFGLFRFNANGILDNTFGSGGQVITDVGGADQVSGIAINSNGKIIVVGTRDNLYLVTVQYNSNGSLDGSFGAGGKSFVTVANGQKCSANSMALQSDGKILIVGDYENPQTYWNNFIVARLNTNGTLDNTFSGNGKRGIEFNGFDFGYGIVQQSDGKILACGIAGFANSTQPYRFALCRLNQDGSLDNNFGTGGKVTTGWPGINCFLARVAIQANERIVLAGTSGNEIGVARYFATGDNLSTPLLTQQPKEKVLEEEVESLQVFPNPAGNLLRVKLSPHKGAAILSVVDVSGKKLLTQMIDGKSNCAVDITKLSIGNYYLVLTRNGKQQSVPFMKSH